MVPYESGGSTMNKIRAKFGKLQLLLPMCVVLSLVLTACDVGGAAQPTAAPAAPTATTGAAAPAATDTPAAAAPAATVGPAAAGIMTISVAQQATWIRN